MWTEEQGKKGTMKQDGTLKLNLARGNGRNGKSQY
jgi:hypothetical protein